MQKKIIKYSIISIVSILILLKSVYFEKLSEVKAENKTTEFDASTYAQEYWNKQITPAMKDAIALSELINLLNNSPDQAFKQYSHALGIGNIRYFMVQGEGEITSVNENDISLRIKTKNSDMLISITTEFVYGNAVRDAVGAINLNEFTNTMNLNSVSAEINKKIRQKIIPPFRNKVKKEDIVEFTGAIELNQKFIDLKSIEVIPVSIQIKN